MIQPNVVVRKGRRSTAVEVGGVKMVGVISVQTRHDAGEVGIVTIELAGRMVEFDQTHDSVGSATAAIMGKVAQLVQQAERDREESLTRENDLRVDNEKLRAKLAEKHRIRVQAGRQTCG